MGATDPEKLKRELLRKKYGISIDKNSVMVLIVLKMQNEIIFFLNKII